MDDIDMDFEAEEPVGYRPIKDIQPHELVDGFKSLTLFNSDPFLRIQAYNLSMVDQFLLSIEDEVLNEYNQTRRTPASTHFLSAQTQMWIFAAYELMRTWRQRASDYIKAFDTKGLDKLLERLEEDEGYSNFSRDSRVHQIKSLKDKPEVIEGLRKDLKRSQIIFLMMEVVRMPLAKHELPKQKNSVANMPGYARINSYCGSLDYEISYGRYILTQISRRDIGEGIRDLAHNLEPPSEEDLQSFKDYIHGKGLEDFDADIFETGKIF